jgi:hypothetical protein
MAFKVPPTATISATYHGAIPGVSYVKRGPTRMATFHLTRNSAAVVAGTANNLAAASAIRITANIAVLSDNMKDDLATAPLGFHFIQFFNLADQQAFYGGPTEEAGTMYLYFARSPDFTGENEFMLDSSKSSEVFPSFDQYKPQFLKVNPFLWIVTIVMDDHPFNDLPLSLPNFESSEDNFLCTASKRFNVATTVVVHDMTDLSKSKRIMLGKLSWGAEVACTIRWTKSGDDNLSANPAEFSAKRFYCSDPVPGVDDELAAQIAKLDDGTQTFNDASGDAFRTVIGSTHINRNVQVSGKWHVPSKIGYFFR